uniref:LOB domain-containing protein n=1 Tax=Kalanchoe fedtschenkoi TaxID=63787 RepID=A0A7N0UM49_KALFE
MACHGDQAAVTGPRSVSHGEDSRAKCPRSGAVIGPCAACKILRRRCAEKCVLAPYFPPSEPHKFTIAHRVFGASNIIKFLQDLPEPQRADAISSMVYEAGARIRDPVYGCAGTIFQLQKQLNELQAELAKAQAEMVTMQCQQAQLVQTLFAMSNAPSSPESSPDQQSSFCKGLIIGPSRSPDSFRSNSSSLLEDDRPNGNPNSMWDMEETMCWS